MQLGYYAYLLRTSADIRMHLLVHTVQDRRWQQRNKCVHPSVDYKYAQKTPT